MMNTLGNPDDYDDDLEKNWLPKFLRRDPSQQSVKSEVPVMFKVPEKVFAPETATSSDEAPAKRKASPKAKVNGATAAPKAKVKAKGKPAQKAKGKTKAKERNVDPAKLDQFGFRLSSIKSKAAAMYAAKGGATLGEVKEKLESTQFNVLTELKEKGFNVDTKMEDGNGSRKITRFFVKSKK